MKWDLGPHHATIPIKMDGHNIEVCVYDAPGQEEHGMIDRYMNSADCIVLCFALDDPTSLENVMNMASSRHPLDVGTDG
jgi:GTPase SAR1 family protein